MTSSDGLHALSCRGINGKTSRNVLKKPQDFFCNLSWSAYGRPDANVPVATYWHRPRKVNELCWHMLDQVVVRPELLDELSDFGLQIVSRIGRQSLAKRHGQPNQSAFSDHFPLLLELKRQPNEVLGDVESQSVAVP